MLKIKVQSMQNGVHRSKKQETDSKSKTKQWQRNLLV